MEPATTKPSNKPDFAHTSPLTAEDIVAAVFGVEDQMKVVKTINEAQWDLENLCRLPGILPHVLGGLKLRIDHSNQARHEAINQIDALIMLDRDTLVDTPNANLVVYSETIGELIDRLVIASLKMNNCVEERRRLAAQHLVSHLTRVALAMKRDIDMDRALCPPRVGFKLYHERDPDETHSAEFRRRGFTVLRAAARASEMAALSSALSYAFVAEPGNSLERQIPNIGHTQTVLNIATRDPLYGLLCELFSGPPQLIASYGHDKPAGSTAHTGPHSDVAHIPGHDRGSIPFMIKVCIASEAVTSECAPTALWAGTHRVPSVEKEPETVDLDQGDILVFDANIKHSATSSISNRVRRTVWLTFGEQWMRPFPGYEYQGNWENLDTRTAALLGKQNPYAT